MKTIDQIDTARCVAEGEHIRSTRHTRSECPTEQNSHTSRRHTMQITVNIEQDQILASEAEIADLIEERGSEARVSVRAWPQHDTMWRTFDGTVTSVEVTGDETPNMRTLLANRIQIAAKAVEAARESKPHGPDEFATVARQIGEGVAVIGELERLWETLFGEAPSIVDVHRAATV